MRRSPDLLVLCYHAVSDSWPADVAISATQLRRQLEFLCRRGYRGATFTEALAAPPRHRTLVVTFDDAFRSTLTRGKPVLDDLGLPGTVFVPTAYPPSGEPMCWPGIDMWKDGPHEHELTPLSWEEIASLASQGWEIGSHTVTHPRLTQLADSALRAELVESRHACIEAIGGCSSIAYPYGDVDARVVQATQVAGYAAAAALPARPHAARPLEWPRIGAYGLDFGGRFAVKVSPLVRRLRITISV